MILGLCFFLKGGKWAILSSNKWVLIWASGVFVWGFIFLANRGAWTQWILVSSCKENDTELIKCVCEQLHPFSQQPTEPRLESQGELMSLAAEIASKNKVRTSIRAGVRIRS